MRLGGNPGVIFGHANISRLDANIGDMICIIGHPAGLPKRIEAGSATDFHNSHIGYNDIDTLGGNSGSGILRSPDGLIVRVHTQGGCHVEAIGHNYGQRISSLLSVSPTLRQLSTSFLGLAMAWKGIEGDERIFHSVFDSNSSTWSPPTPIAGANTSNQPSLAFMGSQSTHDMERNRRRPKNIL